MFDENLKEKLDYIGLNLNEMPEILSKQHKVQYRPQNTQDEKNYRIYRYIDVNDIEILITPTNRLTELTVKYETAIPLKEYLNKDNEDSYEAFIKLLRQISIDDIEELEKQQNELNNEIPLDVKFNKDYLWQIYYSKEEDKYFMLAPITETEFAQIFYVLRAQLRHENKKIFVPICGMDYSGSILTREEIKKLENMLWLFTNNWASIYEVSDKSGNTYLKLTGKTKILETLQSSYVMRFYNREDAIKFYNLVEALFTLQTNYSNFYKFHVKVLEDGKIEFGVNESTIKESNIVDFLSAKYISHSETLRLLKEKKANLSANLSKLKEYAYQKQHEYIDKQHEISRYLECKKTFLGKVKYFFSKKKIKTNDENTKATRLKEDSIKINSFEQPLEKSIYTIQELMELTKILQNESNAVNNLELDTEAAKRRITILEKKVENANLYIKEIDSHKKSLLDFWRFTVKDESNRLAEAPDNKNDSKIRKSFNIRLDFDEVKQSLDNIVRSNFTKEELDSTFIASTVILKDINRVLNDEEPDEQILNDLKREFIKNKEKLLLNLQTENVKLSKQIIHRETERNIFSILGIDENTSIEQYKEKIKEILNNLKTAETKTALNIDLPLYFATQEILHEEYTPFVINPEEAITDITNGEINIYKIVVNENTSFIPLTNIVYFNNLNKTLPVGMDCGTKVIVNTKNLQVDYFEKEENNILTFKDNTIEVLKINIYKYQE